MPGAGTDKTRNWTETPGPIIVLVEPQLGENIGAAARVMANFGLARLRLVKPRDGWPNLQARRSASGADRILDGVALFDASKAAIADCTVVLATTARAHDQAKPVIGPARPPPASWRRMSRRARASPCCSGASAMASRTTRWRSPTASSPFRSIPAFASLNLAQAVALVAYEWFKLASGGALPFVMPQRSEPAPQGADPRRSSPISSASSTGSNTSGRSTSARPCWSTCATSSRACSRRRQDIQTLHGIVVALTEGRKGPARGGVLDGEEAIALRALLAEYGEARAPGERGPVRGLARLLRRNPTEAERALWDGLTKDRRFAGKGIQAAGAGRHPHHRFRVVPAAAGDRPGAGGGKPRGIEGARRAPGLADRARLSRARGRRPRGRRRSAGGARPAGARHRRRG